MTEVTNVAGMLAIKGADGPWIAGFALEKVEEMKRIGHGLEIKMALGAEPPYVGMFILEALPEKPNIKQTPALFKRAGELLDQFISLPRSEEVDFGPDIVSEFMTQGFSVGVWAHREGRDLPEGIPQEFVCFYNDEARVNFCLTMQQQGLE